MQSCLGQQTHARGTVSFVCDTSWSKHLDEPIIVLEVHIRSDRPAKFPSPVHKPCPLGDLSQLVIHLVLELGHHFQNLVPVVVAAGTTEHK